MALLMRRPRPVVLVAGPAGVEGPAAPPAEPGETPGAAAPSTGPDTSWAVAGVLLVIIGGFAAYGIFEVRDPEEFTPGPGFSAFAPMYIIAQSVERLLEPFTKFMGNITAQTPAEGGGTTTQKVTKEDAMAGLELWVARGHLEGAATWQALLDRIRRNTTVIAWGLASLGAMLLSGFFGFQMLLATGLDVPEGLDIAITGLAIGSGTKPLHDLISNLQKSKDDKTNPSQSATTN
jgi:hypothetical protein